MMALVVLNNASGCGEQIPASHRDGVAPEAVFLRADSLRAPFGLLCDPDIQANESLQCDF